MYAIIRRGVSVYKKWLIHKNYLFERNESVIFYMHINITIGGNIFLRTEQTYSA